MKEVKKAETPTEEALESPRAAPPRFAVGDTVWIVTSGNQQRLVECPDCLGQCALTVILGDGSQVSIGCDCCARGWEGSRGQVTVYEWSCDVASAPIAGMEINGESVRYKVTHFHSEGSYQTYPDAVFATKEEAEAESANVLAAHEKDEAHRFAHVKDREGRSKTWAWNVSYHRKCAKEAKRQLEYHESRLVVAKAKAKLPETTETA